MITYENNVFHLKTQRYSYLFCVDTFGMLQHLHFGAPVQTEDAAAFIPTPGLGWGSCTVLEDSDSGSCPDDKPLEWSGSGRGDYRESPLELCGQSTDFRFASFRILKGTVPMICSLPQAHGEAETLEITLGQNGARLLLYYTAFPTALVRRTVLENTGDAPIAVNKLMSTCVDIHGSFAMATFNGGWIAEMRRQDGKVGGTGSGKGGYESHGYQAGL